VPETQRNPAAPAVATPAPSVSRSNSSPASKSIAASPKKKSLAKKRNRKKKFKWTEIIPWSERGASRPPIFGPLLWNLVQQPRSFFQKDPSTGEFHEFMQRDMSMSEWVCVRLIHSAANGDLSATRELIDRLDRPWNKQPEGAPGNNKNGPMIVQIVYEAPVTRQTGAAKAKYEKTLTRGEQMIETIRALPAQPSQDTPGIVYEPIEPGSAE
jgi:hypothetical protein